MQENQFSPLKLCTTSSGEETPRLLGSYQENYDNQNNLEISNEIYFTGDGRKSREGIENPIIL